MSALYTLTHPLVRTACIGLWGLRGYGMHRIPRRGGLLLASNHQSYLDPILIGVAQSRPLHFIARRSLFRFGPFRALIRALHAHPIDRGRADLGAVRLVLDLLRGGNAVLIFPEGTRTRTGALGRAKPGMAHIARRAGVPILPVLVDGSWRAWPRQKPLPGPGFVNILFGSPVTPRDGFPDADDMHQLWMNLARTPRRRIPGGFLG